MKSLRLANTTETLGWMYRCPKCGWSRAYAKHWAVVLCFGRCHAEGEKIICECECKASEGFIQYDSQT